jgi:hypothetical protein
MLQIRESLRAKGRQRLLCSYSNRTERAQIIRVSDISSWYERVVFPGEGLLFEALPEACLEINSDEMPSAILADKIPCSQLEIGLASSIAELLRTPSIDGRGRNGRV